MVYLGIDFGEKNIGLSYGDDKNKLAVAYKTIPASKNINMEIKKIIDEIGALVVVVGRPRLISGEFGVAAKNAGVFAKKIEALGLKVEMEDETATTEYARKKLKARGLSEAEIKKNIDAYAAAEMLQGYLDEKV